MATISTIAAAKNQTKTINSFISFRKTNDGIQRQIKITNFLGSFSMMISEKDQLHALNDDSEETMAAITVFYITNKTDEMFLQKWSTIRRKHVFKLTNCQSSTKSFILSAGRHCDTFTLLKILLIDWKINRTPSLSVFDFGISLFYDNSHSCAGRNMISQLTNKCSAHHPIVVIVSRPKKPIEINWIEIF